MTHFSGFADEYAVGRPTYPGDLFRYLRSVCAEGALAWDCATGNGQAAIALTAYFDRVLASDMSPQQIASAQQHPRVSYWTGSAEASGIRPHCVDLVTVATSAHWFHFEQFYAEVASVLKPGGVLAIWGYHLCRIDPALDEVLRTLYRRIEAYFPPGFSYLTDGYRSIPFPEQEIAAPRRFVARASWDLPALLRFVHTWSGIRRYREQHGPGSLDDIELQLQKLWGAPQDKRDIEWDLALRVARF